jgi:long-chain acyl-CoA synthetase
MSLIAPGAIAMRTAQLTAALRSMRPRAHVLGVLADNCADWIGLDRAAQRSAITLVPLPAFFTAAQLAHAVQVSRMDTLFCPDASAAQALGFAPAGIPDGMPWYRRSVGGQRDSVRPSKMTFTSGTTGAPKPVSLTAREQWEVARSLCEVLAPLKLRRHLCLLPLPVLLENVAGVYAAAEIAGADCVVPPLAEVGMHGASGFDATVCLRALERWEPQSVIVLPQMLAALTGRGRRRDLLAGLHA